MTTATTSKQAYNEIVKSGTSVTQQQMIIGALSAVGEPLSGRELMKVTGLEINAISGRLNDLKKLGLVIERAKRSCSISKRLITPVTINDDCECSYSDDDICTGRC